MRLLQSVFDAEALVGSNDMAFVLRMSKTKVLLCLTAKVAIPTSHRSALRTI